MRVRCTLSSHVRCVAASTTNASVDNFRKSATRPISAVVKSFTPKFGPVTRSARISCATGRDKSNGALLERRSGIQANSGSLAISASGTKRNCATGLSSSRSLNSPSGNSEISSLTPRSAAAMRANSIKHPNRSASDDRRDRFPADVDQDRNRAPPNRHRKAGLSRAAGYGDWAPISHIEGRRAARPWADHHGGAPRRERLFRRTGDCEQAAAAQRAQAPRLLQL